MLTTARTLWHTFRGYRKHLFALIVFGFLGAILEGIGINVAVPLISFFMGGNSDLVAAGSTITKAVAWLFGVVHVPFTFRYLLGFIVALFFLRAISVVLFSYIRGWITADFLSSETKAVLKATLHASWPFLLRQKIGYMHSALVRDLQRTSQLLETLSQAIQSWTGFLMYLLIAINISLVMTIATVVGGGVLYLAIRPFFRSTHKTGEEMAMTEKSISQFLSEHIIGMKSLKAASAEDRAYRNGKALIERLRNLYVHLALSRSVSSSFFQPFSLIFVIVLFAITYHSPSFSIVAFAAELYLIQKIFTYLESGQVALHAIGELTPYAQHAAEFKRQLNAAREEHAEGIEPFVFTHKISFEDVSIEYIPGEPALYGINLAIKKGQTIALIGPSGAGKTTVADLLLRLFRPTSGVIYVDGRPLEQVGLGEWRSHIGYVSQDVFLFNGSIADNIRFYRDLSEAQIKEAAQQANIYEFVASLKDGFDTVVGDRGVTLSGGQRQRIALARALAGNPDILVLDEATSALDTESEQEIQKTIRGLKGQITVVVIAHRLSTIEHADTIVVFDKGRIIETGSPATLRADTMSYFSRHTA